MTQNISNDYQNSNWKSIINFLTISRIFMGLPLILTLTYRRYEYSILILVLGSITDYLDGYLARIKNAKTITNNCNITSSKISVEDLNGSCAGT